MYQTCDTCLGIRKIILKEERKVEKVKEIKKPIKNVSINFADGTHENLEEYVLAGHDNDTWYSVMYSPALDEEKIHLNNMVVDLSNDLRETIKA
jgi:hypothetical protein